MNVGIETLLGNISLFRAVLRSETSSPTWHHTPTPEEEKGRSRWAVASVCGNGSTEMAHGGLGRSGPARINPSPFVQNKSRWLKHRPVPRVRTDGKDVVTRGGDQRYPCLYTNHSFNHPKLDSQLVLLSVSIVLRSVLSQSSLPMELAWKRRP